ncbi:LolA family protein [Halostagnicola bangensis]
MKRSRLRAALLLTLGLVVIAGCAGIIGDDLSGDDLQDELNESEPPEAVSATLVTEATFSNETIEVTEDLWMRSDGASRSESEYGTTATTSVDDGTQIWTETEGTNTVTVMDSEEPFGDRLGATYDANEQLLEEFDIAEIDETTVDGHDVYHLVLEPEGNESIDRSIDIAMGDSIYSVPVGSAGGESTSAGLTDDPERTELWLDREHFFPVKYEFETADGGYTMEYQDLTFDPDIADEKFEYEPPENATVEEINLPSRTEFDTVGQADLAVDFDVEAPTYEPESYDLETVSVSKHEAENRTNVRSSYATADDSLLSVEATDDPDAFAFDGESIQIGNRTGTIDRMESIETVRLTWTCGDIGYYVGGPQDLGEETVVSVAESISCEA